MKDQSYLNNGDETLTSSDGDYSTRAKITKPSEETQDITDRKKENRKTVHVPKGYKKY